jgi:hypothetical protein
MPCAASSACRPAPHIRARAQARRRNRQTRAAADCKCCWPRTAVRHETSRNEVLTVVVPDGPVGLKVRSAHFVLLGALCAKHALRCASLLCALAAAVVAGFAHVRAHRHCARMCTVSIWRKACCLSTCVLPVACCLLHVACCMLPVACRMLLVSCCMLPGACCMLPVVCCMLPVVCCACSWSTCRMGDSPLAVSYLVRPYYIAVNPNQHRAPQWRTISCDRPLGHALSDVRPRSGRLW